MAGRLRPARHSSSHADRQEFQPSLSVGKTVVDSLRAAQAGRNQQFGYVQSKFGLIKIGKKMGLVQGCNQVPKTYAYYVL